MAQWSSAIIINLSHDANTLLFLFPIRRKSWNEEIKVMRNTGSPSVRLAWCVVQLILQ